MHGLPGGGAEMLVDEVRLDVSPKKGSAENWLKVMREAQGFDRLQAGQKRVVIGKSFSQLKHQSPAGLGDLH